MGNYSPLGFINSFKGDVDAEALFRKLSASGKVRFAMNMDKVLYVALSELPEAMVVCVTPPAETDTVIVMPPKDVAVLLTFIFFGEQLQETFLPNVGHIHLLCEDDIEEFTIVLSWNAPRQLWDIQKFSGHLIPHAGSFFLGPRAETGRTHAIVT